MSYAPVVFVDDFFNLSIYPDHVITASEEAPGHDVLKLGNGRRSLNDYATGITANVAWWAKAQCDRVRYGNCVALDRGHNLTGERLLILVSNDDTAPGEVSAVDVTIPSVTGTDIDDPLGVVTEDGAWIKRFPGVSGIYWRAYVDAMGAGLRPEIVRLQVGLAWSPPVFGFPWSEDEDELGGMESESDAGWIGSSRMWNRRSGVLRIKLAEEGGTDYDEARLHLGGFFGRGRNPAWLCYDDEQADRAVCAVRPKGVNGFKVDRDWTNKRQAEVPWVELEPLSP